MKGPPTRVKNAIPTLVTCLGLNGQTAAPSVVVEVQDVIPNVLKMKVGTKDLARNWGCIHKTLSTLSSAILGINPHVPGTVHNSRWITSSRNIFPFFYFLVPKHC